VLDVTRLLLALGICSILAAACSQVAFVDEVTIVNDTAYSANVDVTGGARDGWLGLTTVGPESTRTVGEVIDQGDTWIFRFDYVGMHVEELEVSRRDLERNEWRVSVPESFEDRLRDTGVPPPPS
jgi:hypothetical protein